MHYKVEGEPNLIKRADGVVLNTNDAEYEAFIARRNAALETKNRLDKLEKDNGEIKDTLKLILQLLRDDGK